MSFIMELSMNISITLYSVTLICLSGTSANSWMNEKNDIIPYQVTNNTATHIEADLFIPGNILYSDILALYTTDGNKTTVIVGQTHRSPVLPYTEGIGTNATFSVISSFAQMNVTHVLIADSVRRCIRILDRTTNQTEQFVGICHKGPWKSPVNQTDGNLENSVFGKITGLTYHQEQEIIYIFEQGLSRRITKADVKANLVSTIVKKYDFEGRFHEPRDGVVDAKRGVVYITISYGIAEINVGNDSFRYLTHSDRSSYTDGPLADTEWSWNTGMAMHENNTLIVADSMNNRLRVVDLPSTNVTTWCFNNTRNPSNPCYIRNPVSIYVIDCDVYIGGFRLISKLRLPKWECKKKDDKQNSNSSHHIINSQTSTTGPTHSTYNSTTLSPTSGAPTVTRLTPMLASITTIVLAMCF